MKRKENVTLTQNHNEKCWFEEFKSNDHNQFMEECSHN
jgi:hypothetical protein